MGLFNFLFLSTPSARRATFPTSKPTRKQTYFNPRPPRGGRPTPSKTGRRGGDFYPRPPRGGRPLKDDGLVAIKKFLSTPSARRATACENHRTRPECYFYPRPPRGGRRAALRLLHPRRPISIHALREEGDMMLLWSGWTVADFYPRPPRGGRRLVRGRQHRGKLISIHALREEGDPSPRFARGGAQGFLSTPSARRATKKEQV